MPTVADRTPLEVPVTDPAQPVAATVALMPAEPSTRTFQLQSRGGYLRTVVGSIAYLDVEAQTYMISTSDGTLVRVPLRDLETSDSAGPR